MSIFVGTFLFAHYVPVHRKMHFQHDTLYAEAIVVDQHQEILKF